MTKSPLISLIALAVAACVSPSQPTPSLAAATCIPAANSIDSRPGREWMSENGWRFPSAELALQAYKHLADQSSPWPDWYQPYQTVLPVGTRFQMAIGSGQTPMTPSGFGTFDKITTVADVRYGLAVRTDWKPVVDRVVTYEVIQPLPVRIGPIGPQVDPVACKLLPGRWSQFEMKVDRADRIKYLRVIEVRRIH